MGMTYDRIYKKLGFKPEECDYHFSGYEDDSKLSPFSVLNAEELDCLIDYLVNLKNA